MDETISLKTNPMVSGQNHDLRGREVQQSLFSFSKLLKLAKQHIAKTCSPKFQWAATQFTFKSTDIKRQVSLAQCVKHKPFSITSIQPLVIALLQQLEQPPLLLSSSPGVSTDIICLSGYLSLAACVLFSYKTLQ